MAIASILHFTNLALHLFGVGKSIKKDAALGSRLDINITIMEKISPHRFAFHLDIAHLLHQRCLLPFADKDHLLLLHHTHIRDHQKIVTIVEPAPAHLNARDEQGQEHG